MKVLAIIPARSGSKGLKNKNIKLLCGKPLISYTIEAAIKSKVFDEVMVSTDSRRYANIARQYGASVPFYRSKHNSGDLSSTNDVIREVLLNYKKDGVEYDAFCILQPTSPFRTKKDIVNAYKVFRDKAKVAVVSVTESDHPIQWYNSLNSDLSLNGFVSKKDVGRRRQDCKKFYRINGAIYFVYSKEFLKNDNYYRNGSYAYIMKSIYSIDIDSINDFNYAEYLLKTKALYTN